jgi:hypothetical protein
MGRGVYMYADLEIQITDPLSIFNLVKLTSLRLIIKEI